MSSNLLEILQTTRGLLLSSSCVMTETSDADINQALDQDQATDTTFEKNHVILVT